MLATIALCLMLQTPDISGPCRYGDILHKGQQVTISGNDVWIASGTLDRGLLRLVWVHRPTGRTANAVYVCSQDGAIEGCWGWSDSCDFVDDALEGEVSAETVRASRP